MDGPKNIKAHEVRLLFEGEAKAPAITIYLPTHRSASPPHMSEDQIRLKNLKNRALDIIRRRDDGRDFEQEFSDKVDALFANQKFWESLSEGLLICARPGQFQMFYLPLDTEEYLSVSFEYHLSPVFGMLRDSKDYYVLTVSQHLPALFKGDLYGLYPTNLKLPESLLEGLNIDEMGKENEQPTSAYGGNMSPVGFNGRGGDKNPAEEERQRFWRMIDHQLLAHTDRKLPLILAGTESEAVEYRNQSRYPNILKDTIDGGFGGTSAHELYPKAREIIQKDILNPDHERVIEEYERLRGQAPTLAADDFAAITDAAEDGRIDKLLVGSIRYTTDTVRDNDKPVSVITFPTEDTAEAVNETARIVWGSHGTIVNLEQSHMPKHGSLMLATMRY